MIELISAHSDVDPRLSPYHKAIDKTNLWGMYFDLFREVDRITFNNLADDVAHALMGIINRQSDLFYLGGAKQFRYELNIPWFIWTVPE